MALRYCSHLSTSEGYKLVLQACNAGLVIHTESNGTIYMIRFCETGTQQYGQIAQRYPQTYVGGKGWKWHWNAYNGHCEEQGEPETQVLALQSSSEKISRKSLLFVIFKDLLDREMCNTGMHNCAQLWCLLIYITKNLSPQTCSESEKYFLHYNPVKNGKTLHWQLM